MSRLKRTLLLWLAGFATCLFVLSCGSRANVNPDPGDGPQAVAPMDLPAPSAIRLPSETQSAYLKQATDFEQDLPFRNVGMIGDRLGFIPAKFDPISYALYWLNVPPSSAEPTVQFDPGFDRELAWLGIANFSTDRWDFGHGEQLQYGPQHRQAGMILVAVVCTNYDELEWLVAGGSAPPFVKSVSPRAMSAGTVNDFRVSFTDDPAQSYSWQFGGGLSITQSSLANPKYSVLTPGDYSGTLTVANSAGTVVHDFSYSVLPATQYEPLHLYAVPSKSMVFAGEEITVSIRTGLIPQSEAAVTARVALQFPTGLQYVSDSFNTGAPGGEKWAIDGFWALQPDDDAFFLSYPDSWLAEVPGPGSGLQHMEISLAAAKLTPQFGSGVLCNLKLKCSEPGTYALSFLEATDVVVTSFTTMEGEVLWHDISNEGQPSITVLP
ncbi:MAG: PKD domain-containing protein [Planctomycetales bacterium]|nr:PKD domain-containing protein [bacterium]UNM09623.1 MAG: PKD domain-containing protein [Planctomycetales bacterium]